MKSYISFIDIPNDESIEVAYQTEIHNINIKVIHHIK